MRHSKYIEEKRDKERLAAADARKKAKEDFQEKFRKERMKKKRRS